MKGILYKSILYLRRSSPTILSCMGAIGVVATSVMAVKATSKAQEKIDRADETEPLTKTEKVKLTWCCYIPATLVGLSTIACIFGANAMNKQNQASLVSAYAMLSESYKNYRNSANVVYGDEADSKIKAQMAKDTYVSAGGYSLYASDLDSYSEKILCYDLLSERYFTTTMAAVLNAQYHINRNLCLRGNTSINEFYEFLGINGVENGDEIGWSLDEMIVGGLMWLDFDNRIVGLEDGMECCIISTLVDPNTFQTLDDY